MKEAELQIFDAVVAVGGDGTIFEILQVQPRCCRVPAVRMPGQATAAVLHLPIASLHVSSRANGAALSLCSSAVRRMMWHLTAPQGYFHGEDWGARVGTPFCLVPSGSGNALAANCSLWTPQAKPPLSRLSLMQCLLSPT